MKIRIVNARHIKDVPGHKTDKQDSAWICRPFLAGLLKPGYISEREERELCALTRYRNRLIQYVASWKTVPSVFGGLQYQVVQRHESSGRRGGNQVDRHADRERTRDNGRHCLRVSIVSQES